VSVKDTLTENTGASAVLYIQQVAQMIGVSASAIRAWEKDGLVSPGRTDSGYRIYTMDDVERLTEIRDLVRIEKLNTAGVKRIMGGAKARAPGADGEDPMLGPRLKAMRRANGSSLRALAAKTGLSPSYISAVERSISTPSVASLQRLAAALGTNLVDLLGRPSSAQEKLVVRAGESQRLPLGIPGVAIDQLSEIETVLEPLLFTLEPGASSVEPYSHEGEEFIYVVEGTFAIRLDGLHEHTLSKGDSITFQSPRPHDWWNPGDEVCTLVWINTPRTF
jgi:transcriptional regulator with XRE-family HTH domain